MTFHALFNDIKAAFQPFAKPAPPRLCPDLDDREAKAIARNDCRAIGKARQERYARVHAALEAGRAG